ncbi:unknown [Clostridium sp. CAG:914]|jgi:hypothetical protein|nr:unknown [Clostridium sp. CAG:914]
MPEEALLDDLIDEMLENISYAKLKSYLNLED